MVSASSYLQRRRRRRGSQVPAVQCEDAHRCSTKAARSSQTAPRSSRAYGQHPTKQPASRQAPKPSNAPDVHVGDGQLQVAHHGVDHRLQHAPHAAACRGRGRQHASRHPVGLGKGGPERQAAGGVQLQAQAHGRQRAPGSAPAPPAFSSAWAAASSSATQRSSWAATRWRLDSW